MVIAIAEPTEHSLGIIQCGGGREIMGMGEESPKKLTAFAKKDYVDMDKTGFVIRTRVAVGDDTAG